jgi:hypothetical protein
VDFYSRWLKWRTRSEAHGRISGNSMSSQHSTTWDRGRPRLWTLAMLNNCCIVTSWLARPVSSTTSINFLHAQRLNLHLASEFIYSPIAPQSRSRRFVPRLLSRLVPGKGPHRRLLGCGDLALARTWAATPSTPICTGCALVRSSSQWISSSAT